MSLVHMENENYDEMVKEGLVLVDFYAEWCGPCKMLAPMLEALSEQRNNLKIIKINVDKREDIARRFGIMSVPTLYVYKDGIIVSEKKGFQTIEMLNEWLDSIIK